MNYHGKIHVNFDQLSKWLEIDRTNFLIETNKSDLIRSRFVLCFVLTTWQVFRSFVFIFYTLYAFFIRMHSIVYTSEWAKSNCIFPVGLPNVNYTNLNLCTCAGREVSKFCIIAHLKWMHSKFTIWLSHIHL